LHWSKALRAEKQLFPVATASHQQSLASQRCAMQQEWEIKFTASQQQKRHQHQQLPPLGHLLNQFVSSLKHA
jgi:hypothetical protein